MPDSPMNDDEASEEGYDAYWDGVDSGDNPHAHGTTQHSSWDEGWLQAQLDDEQEDEG